MRIVKVETTLGQGQTRFITIAVEAIDGDKTLEVESQPSFLTPSPDTITIANGSGNSFVVRQVMKTADEEVQEEETTKSLLKNLIAKNKLSTEELSLLTKNELKINSNSTRTKFITWGKDIKNANRHSAYLLGQQSSLITAENKTELINWAKANSTTRNHFALGILKNK